MDKIKFGWKSGMLVLYAVLVLLAICFMDSFTHTDADKLFLTPIFQDDRGWDIYTLTDGSRKTATIQALYDSMGETFYLSRTLDEALESGGYTILELDSVEWQMSVFLDGTLIYTVAPDIDNRIGFVEFPKEYTGIPIGNEYIRLSLPPDYGGKTLTLAMAANVGTEYHHGLPMVRLSSENILKQTFVTSANRLAIPATAYMMAAILLMGLFFYNRYYGQKSWSILLLTLAALLQALRVLLNFEFYIGLSFSMDKIPAEFLIPLALGLPILYMLVQMRRWRKWCAPFVLIPLALSLACHILGRFPMFAFITAWSYDAVLYVSLLALCVFAVLEWRRGTEVYRLFTPALFAVISVIIIGAVGFMMAGRGDSQFISILRAPVLMMGEAFQYCGAILLLLGGAVSFIQTVRRAAGAQSEVLILSVKNALITENIRSMQESCTEIAAMRHDMLRHLQTMLTLSYAGSSDRLESYLEELTKETENIVPMQVCRHPIVNAIVTRALTRARQAGIHMELNVDVPADITISDNDLCTLLMNMLDNAIEAVAALPDGKKRSIELTMHVRGSYLFIETLNSFEGTVLIDANTGLPKSTKGRGHGYGMKAMSGVAEKYKSKLQFRQETDGVMVRTALFMPEKDD